MTTLSDNLVDSLNLDQKFNSKHGQSPQTADEDDQFDLISFLMREEQTHSFELQGINLSQPQSSVGMQTPVKACKDYLPSTDIMYENEPTAIDHNRQVWCKSYYGADSEQSSKKPIRFSNVADYFKDEEEGQRGDNQPELQKLSFTTQALNADPNFADRKYLKLPDSYVKRISQSSTPGSRTESETFSSQQSLTESELDRKLQEENILSQQLSKLTLTPPTLSAEDSTHDSFTHDKSIREDEMKRKQDLVQQDQWDSQYSFASDNNRKRIKRDTPFRAKVNIHPPRTCAFFDLSTQQFPKLTELSTKKRSDANFLKLIDSQGETMLFNVYRDCDMGIMPGQSQQFFDEYLFETIQDEDLNTDDEVLEAGVRQTFEDLGALNVMIQKPNFVKQLHNYEKIKNIESAKWTISACT